jgi:hypothetical protein
MVKLWFHRCTYMTSSQVVLMFQEKNNDINVMSGRIQVNNKHPVISMYILKEWFNVNNMRQKTFSEWIAIRRNQNLFLLLFWINTLTGQYVRDSGNHVSLNTEVPIEDITTSPSLMQIIYGVPYDIRQEGQRISYLFCYFLTNYLPKNNLKAKFRVGWDIYHSILQDYNP